MARQCRLIGEDCFYHITSRGDDRKPIYRSPRDYDKFLEYILRAKEKFHFFLHAYCLMTNHYHLLLETPKPNLPDIMQYVNTSYTTYHNVKQKRSGHLFQGRYKSILIEQESYYDRLTRYIHRNPVRAKIVKKPSEYRWSSCNAFLRGVADTYIDIDRVRECLSLDLKQYRSFAEPGTGDDDPFKEVYAGFILGGKDFIEEKLSQMQGDLELKDYSNKRAIKNITDPEEIITAVAKYYKTDKDALITSVKRPMTAKKTAVYLLRRKTGLTNAEIGKIFNMNASAVSKASGNIEIEINNDRGRSKELENIVSTFEA